VPLGIMTDRDLGSRVVARELPPETPVTAVMSAPVASVAPERPAFDVLFEMTRRNVRHLAVVDEGRLIGVVSSRDVMLLQASHPVALAQEIEEQTSVDGLAEMAPRLVPVVRWLVGEGVSAFDLGRIVAELNDRLVRRAVALTEGVLEAQGQGSPPVAYSWIAAGSEGRREQTLRTDQDNGLVYDDPPPEAAAPAADYFARLAQGVGAALVRLGFPLCAGGFMASNPEWCQPVSVWRRYFASWMEVPHPERVLNAALYFDMRAVAGSEAPARTLWDWVCEQAPSRVPFQRYMARAAVDRQVPLGFFGQFVVERSGAHRAQLDLKGRGVFPLTQAMRVYALWLGLRETNTMERLARAGECGVFAPTQVDELRDAWEVICRLRVRHQLACLDAGQPPDNFVDPRGLPRSDRVLLKEAFRSVGWLQRDLEERFQTAVIG
jgi:CBS domain-containing protein